METGDHEDTVAVLSHGGVINGLLHTILGTEKILCVNVDYAGITRLFPPARATSLSAPSMAPSTYGICSPEMSGGRQTSLEPGPRRAGPPSARRGHSPRGELRAELIAGGRSNLTFLVSDDASKWVLRRPPLHGLTPSAHDMAREYRVVAALADTPVPVARAVTMCNDDSVLGAPFQMVAYVPGRVVRTADELAALGDRDTIDGCVDALIRVLADLHAVDPAAVGLGDFGKPNGYLERQMRRWGGQWEHVRLPTIRETMTFDGYIRF